MFTSICTKELPFVHFQFLKNICKLYLLNIYINIFLGCFTQSSQKYEFTPNNIKKLLIDLNDPAFTKECIQRRDAKTIEGNAY